jgi:hypothetical protein
MLGDFDFSPKKLRTDLNGQVSDSTHHTFCYAGPCYSRLRVNCISYSADDRGVTTAVQRAFDCHQGGWNDG